MARGLRQRRRSALLLSSSLLWLWGDARHAARCTFLVWQHLPYMATTFLIWQVFRYFEERTPESRVEVRRNTPFGTFLIWQPLA